jgi:hypothetical protein
MCTYIEYNYNRINPEAKTIVEERMLQDNNVPCELKPV